MHRFLGYYRSTFSLSLPPRYWEHKVEIMSVLQRFHQQTNKHWNLTIDKTLHTAVSVMKSLNMGSNLRVPAMLNMDAPNLKALGAVRTSK